MRHSSLNVLKHHKLCYPLLSGFVRCSVNFLSKNQRISCMYVTTPELLSIMSTCIKMKSRGATWRSSFLALSHSSATYCRFCFVCCSSHVCLHLSPFYLKQSTRTTRYYYFSFLYYAYTTGFHVTYIRHSLAFLVFS